MPVGPYSPCPCGSGKQFKWCCGAIYNSIERALDQESKGQHETALRTINEVVTAHPDNPEAWGQKAHLLAIQGKRDEAEEALEKAFGLNPNYPFGLLLRANFRYEEGEVAGALLLARRAAEAYAPEALDFLFQVYSIIFECEMKMNRPVAGRAALRIAIRCQPAHEDAQSSFDALFGDNGRLPRAARREYPLLSPAADLAGDRRAAWNKALGNATSPRLGDLARAFDLLAHEDSRDSAAWYNLGLTRAWLGDNNTALDALNRYLELDPPDGQAAIAGALMEVLRLGAGLEEQSDYNEYAFLLRIPQQAQPLLDLIKEWRSAGQLLVPDSRDPGVFFGLILDLSPAGLITVGRPAAEHAGLAGYLMIAQNMVRVWGPNKAAIERLRENFRERLQFPLGDAVIRRGPLAYQDVGIEALLFPTAKGNLTNEQVLAHAQVYFEDTWVHQPRKALSGNTPLEAARQPIARRKLLGVLQFLQDCIERGNLADYDFDRLRRKLGLLTGSAGTSAAAGGAAGTPTDFAALTEADLSALVAENLSPEQLEKAYQASQRLNAATLSERFARALIARPAQPDRPDRYPWYAFLTQKALEEGNTDAALDYVNEGEKADCEHNEGRRRNDYELRRAQVHVKRGEADAAQDVFQRLIDRVPANLDYRGKAAEAMLSLKQGARALHFAEEGLVKARQQNNRDSEQYLMELAAAARKMSG